MKRLLLACSALLCTAIGLYAQPVINGTISPGEYGTNNQSGNWYLTWDNTNLYVAVNAGNPNDDALNLYLDINPAFPVNGGSNANGNLNGTSYDNVNFSSAPFRIDHVLFLKPGYRDLNSSNGIGTYANSNLTGNAAVLFAASGNVREAAIPWSLLGGSKPAAFNFMGFLSYDGSGGGIFEPSPSVNPAAHNIGTNATANFYFTVPSTTTSTNNFSRLSRTNAGGGTVAFTGSAAYYDLTVTNSTTFNVGNTSMVTMSGNVWVADNSTLTVSGSSTFTMNNGSQVLRGGSANISGVTVQKTIPAKAIRRSLLLASPVLANLNSAGWQRQIHVTGGTPLSQPNVGNCATVPSGWDETLTGANSMFTYNNAQIPAYVPIGSPNTVVQTPGVGYRVLVRGDRTANGSCNLLDGTTNNQTAVTLNATGTLQTQEQNTALPTGFSLIGNPYAADLDFDNLTWVGVLDGSSVQNKYWSYNPAINNNAGNNNVTWSTYDNTLFSFPEALNMGANPNIIAQGQAFFVNRTSGNAAVTPLFSPNYISLGNAPQTGFFRNSNTGDMKARIRVKLMNAQAAQIDEMVTRFLTHSHASSTGQTRYDAQTLNTGNEMISSLKAGSPHLAIQSRAYTSNLNDTIALNVKGIAGTTYSLQFSELGNTVEEVFLRDKLLGTLTNAKTTASYSFVASASLPSTQRFELIFRSSGTLAARFMNVQAQRTSASTASVTFSTQEDGAVQQFQLERSTNGQSFEAVAAPVKGSNMAGSYKYTIADAQAQASTLYYRVKATNADASVQLSQVVKLSDGKAALALSLYPNPVKDQLNIQLQGMEAQRIGLRITDNTGRTVHSQQGIQAAGSLSLSVSVAALSAGSYHVQIVNADGVLAQGTFLK